MGRQGWKVSFDRGDSFRERQRAHGQAHSAFRAAVATAPPPPPPSAPAAPAARRDPAPAPTPPGEDRCARGDWCAGRTITIEGGTRTVTPATTPRAYCHACEGYIGLCLDGDPQDGHHNGMAALYRRLHAELGEARQSEVMVKVPFGPSLPLSEAVDAHMRLMADTLCSWEERLRDVDSLSPLPEEVASRPQDSEDDLKRSLNILSPRISALLSLAAQPMMRTYYVRAVPEGADILSDDGASARAVVELGGQHAGEEVMHLHYLARRLLLETNPPMPLLPDFRCRVCERKLLRKAPPPWHEDGIWFRSRCDNCGDEMTDEDYKQNALRWIAYERAHLETAMLAG